MKYCPHQVPIELANLCDKCNIEELKETILALKQVLLDLADPLTAERRDLEEGYELNFPILLEMLNSSQYYKDKAKAALKTYFEDTASS